MIRGSVPGEETGLGSETLGGLAIFLRGWEMTRLESKPTSTSGSLSRNGRALREPSVLGGFSACLGRGLSGDRGTSPPGFVWLGLGLGQDWQRQADLHFWFWVCCCTFPRGEVRGQAQRSHCWYRPEPPPPPPRIGEVQPAPLSGPSARPQGNRLLLP